MLTVVERVLLLARTVLGDAPTASLARLAALAEEEEIDEGDPLWRPGDPADELHLLVDGEISLRDGALPPPAARGLPAGAGGPFVSRAADPGRELARARPGDLVDLATVLRGGARTVFAVAHSASLVLRVAREELWALLGEEPELSRALLVAVVRS